MAYFTCSELKAIHYPYCKIFLGITLLVSLIPNSRAFLSYFCVSSDHIALFTAFRNYRLKLSSLESRRECTASLFYKAPENSEAYLTKSCFRFFEDLP